MRRANADIIRVVAELVELRSWSELKIIKTYHEFGPVGNVLVRDKHLSFAPVVLNRHLDNRAYLWEILRPHIKLEVQLLRGIKLNLTYVNQSTAETVKSLPRH